MSKIKKKNGAPSSGPHRKIFKADFPEDVSYPYDEEKDDDFIDSLIEENDDINVLDFL